MSQLVALPYPKRVIFVGKQGNRTFGVLFGLHPYCMSAKFFKTTFAGMSFLFSRYNWLWVQNLLLLLDGKRKKRKCLLLEN